jgi:plastocyanin
MIILYLFYLAALQQMNFLNFSVFLFLKESDYFNNKNRINMLRMIFIGFLVIMALACRDNNEEEIPDEIIPPTGSNVLMNASSFIPSTLTVSPGTTVRWNNSSQVDHTVTSNNGLFNELLSPGESFSFTFTRAGSYSYICTLHTGMSGTIIVQ